MIECYRLIIPTSLTVLMNISISVLSPSVSGRFELWKFDSRSQQAALGRQCPIRRLGQWVVRSSLSFLAATTTCLRPTLPHHRTACSQLYAISRRSVFILPLHLIHINCLIAGLPSQATSNTGDDFDDEWTDEDEEQNVSPSAFMHILGSNACDMTALFLKIPYKQAELRLGKFTPKASFLK